jgi:hypothetical protein
VDSNRWSHPHARQNAEPALMSTSGIERLDAGDPVISPEATRNAVDFLQRARARA